MLHQPHHESSEFRFCTNFAVTGVGLETHGFERSLEEIGDSVLVVGDERTLRVHVHTDEPERAVALFETAGEVSRLDVADMREQVADRSARVGARPRPARRPCAASWRWRAAPEWPACTRVWARGCSTAGRR